MKWTFTLITLLSLHSFGQEGPGGVQNTDGTTDLYLWLDANTIDYVTNSNNISDWYDQSGYGNHVSQSTTNNKPNFYENVVNSYPYAFFDGGERFEGTLQSPLSAPVTLITVAYFDSLNQSSGNNDWVASFGSDNATNSTMNIARKSPGANSDEYFQYDGTNDNFGPVITGQTWTILTQTQNSSAPYHGMWLDGAVQVVDDFTSGALSTNTDFRIADWADSPGASYMLAGKIPEVILFNKILNTAEMYIVHSYLGAKYNIANSNDRYAGDDPGNGDNDHDVIGLGTESDGSNTVAHAGGIELTASSGFENGDYLMAGHGVKTNSLNTTDVGGGYDARWDRAFWFDVTDASTTLEIDLIFDISKGGLGGVANGTASNYKLVYRAGTSGSWTTIASAVDYSNDRIEFENITPTADGFYTLATIDQSGSPIGYNPVDALCNGPGGIEDRSGTSNLQLWLDPLQLNPEDADPIVTFTDLSGYGAHADQFNVADIPEFATNVVNGMPTARFTGNNYIAGNLNSALGSPSTIIGVGYFNNSQGAGDNDYIFSTGNPTTSGQNTSIGRRRSDTPSQHNRYYSWDGSATYFGPVISTATWNIFQQENTTSSGFHNLYIDNVAQTVDPYAAAFNATSSVYRVAMWQNNFNSGLDGDIGEIIVFDRLLNSAERNIINSYLSAKFAVSVTNDKYVGDDAGNGDHDLYVVGIGTESDGSNTCAHSVGMMMEQSANFGNGDYLLWGISKDTNDVNLTDATDATGMLEARWERLWWLDITDGGSTAEVDITFDFSDAGNMGFPAGDPTCYYLIYRAGTSGNWTIIDIASSINGDQVIFQDIQITSDGYYTLGTCDYLSSPLPIELSHFMATPFENKKVRLDWTTSSELNSDYFTVQRSKDGLNWENILMVDGAGNSTKEIDYLQWDENPLSGVSYYRLRQTDMDGKNTYSNIQSVNFTGIEIINAFPNPADDDITVIINLTSKYDLTLNMYSVLGEPILQKFFSREEGFSEIKLDVSPFASGTYILKIETSTGEYFDQKRIQLR